MAAETPTPRPLPVMVAVEFVHLLREAADLRSHAVAKDLLLEAAYRIERSEASRRSLLLGGGR